MNYNFSKLTKEQIKQAVIKIWETGTSKDSRIAVCEAQKYGVSYEELCEYKHKQKEGCK